MIFIFDEDRVKSTITIDLIKIYSERIKKNGLLVCAMRDTATLNDKSNTGLK
jgi:hypothetical protein